MFEDRGTLSLSKCESFIQGPGEASDRNPSCGAMRKPANKAALNRQGDRVEENFLQANILFKLWQQNTSNIRLVQTPKEKNAGENRAGKKELHYGNFHFSFSFGKSNLFLFWCWHSSQHENSAFQSAMSILSEPFQNTLKMQMMS